MIPATTLLALCAAAPCQSDSPAEPVASSRAESAPDGREEAEQAMARFVVPRGFEVNVFAAEPMLAHPVAFTFDALGRLFVAETFRHSQGVTDIREHMDWLEDDLAIKTVEDRVEMFRRHESEEEFQRGYATASERVSRIVDEDGDGVADAATVFASGFDDPAAGIAAGLLATLRADGGTELWFTCIPSLWKLIDEDDDGVAEAREAHSSGYGLRVALLGHDLHGLAIGPDGRLYFSIGDRGFNVTTGEGKKLVRFGTGAVFRCELDGSELEIFCDGLRNPQELVFDDHGNLFTLDNNSDGGDEARWTWLLEGSDTGWRQAYQWVTAPTTRGPWNEELLWKPHFAEQPAYILPPIANFTSGPSGLTMYPGTGFHDSWRGKFFVCDFRGNPGYSGIYSFENEADRSGFALVNAERFVWDVLPTDVDFGIDGSLYWSDWVTGWNRTGKGRIYRVTPAERSAEEQAAVDEVARMLAVPVGELGVDVALGALGHEDRRVRARAQKSLADRLVESAEESLAASIERVAAQGNGVLARLHASWTLREALRRLELRDRGWEGSGAMITDLAETFSRSEETALSVEACALTGDLARIEGVDLDAVEDALVGLMGHGEARVRLAAAQAIGRAGCAGALADVAKLLAAEGGDDPWIRHAATRSIERLQSRNDGLEWRPSGDEPVHVQRAAIVLARRAGDVDRLIQGLESESELVRDEAIRGIYDANVIGAFEALAQMLPRLDPESDAPLALRRALHAAREVGSLGTAEILADFVVAHPESAIAGEALSVLARWHEPRTRDGILKDHRPVAGGAEIAGRIGRDHAVATPAFAERIPPAVSEPLVAFHVAMSGEEIGEGRRDALLTIAVSDSQPAAARVAAYEHLLERTAGDELVDALTEATVAGLESLRPLRATAFATLEDERAAEVLTELARAPEVRDRREGIRVLGAQRTPVAMEAFAELGAALEADAPDLVDWMRAAEGHPAEAVQAALAAHEAAWAAADDPLAPWRMCLTGGDEDTGRAIFRAKPETTCMKCHVVGDEGGSEAGPDLDSVGSRLSAEDLLRSIVTPNETIAEGYESWILALEDGETLAGRILEETADNVVLETSEKEIYDVPSSEITARRRDVSAMPADVSTHLTRTEMRDLITFLASLRDESPPR